jgi:hypothetical protein
MNFAAATADEAMAVARAHFGADLVSLSGPVLQIADVIYEPTLEPVEPEPEPEPEAKADHKSKKSHG